ncbi:MAG: hypothetical protein MHMPM18_002692 [Marteilia pararefringens]
MRAIKATCGQLKLDHCKCLKNEEKEEEQQHDYDDDAATRRLFIISIARPHSSE